MVKPGKGAFFFPEKSPGDGVTVGKYDETYKCTWSCDNHVLLLEDYDTKKNDRKEPKIMMTW